MTFEEKLKLALEIGNRFMSMDRYCQIIFQCWPHDETDGFSHNQTAYEAIIVFEGGYGYKKPCIGKSLEEALDKALLVLKQTASSRAQEIRSRAEDALLWEELASKINL